MEAKPTLALKRAIAEAGGQSALARACGVKQGHVWHWLNKSLRAPAEQVLAIEAAAGGAVSRYELRPDIYGRESVPAKAATRQEAVPPAGAVGTGAKSNPNIAEQIALLEAKQHRAVREVLLKQKGAVDRLAKLDRAIAALRALAESGR